MPIAATQQVMAGKAIELSDELLEHLGVRPGDHVDVSTSGPGTIEIRRAFVPLSLAEIIERFRIAQPVDMAALRAGIEEDMAGDALRSLER